MQNTKIFKLLNALSHPERQRFLEFLKSPYFNQNDALIKCFVALLPSLQKTKAIEQNEQQIWKHIYPSAKYDKARFHRVCSDLLKETERFLAYFKFAQNKSLQNVYTLQSLNEKRAMDHLPHFMNYTYLQHKKNEIRDGEFYYNQFLIEDQKSMFDVNSNNRTAEKNLNEVVENLDKFYFINKLRCACAILHYKSITNSSFEIALIEEIINYIKLNPKSNVPIIEIYYLIFQTLTIDDNESYYLKLKDLLEKNNSTFSQQACREMFSHAIQFCIKKIVSGDVNYYKELFYFYEKTLTNNYIQTNNELNPYDFKNIVTTALRVNEFDWTENFIKEYKLQLPIEHQENAYTFNMARVYFFQKKYDDVLKLLQQVEYDDVFYLLDTKLTLIKTFYELNEIDSLTALLESFKMLLRRKKIISEQQRVIYTHFIQYVKKFISVSDKVKLQIIQTDLQKPQQVADIGWLREKIEELLKKKR